MSPENRAGVFDRFARGEQMGAHFEGAGLGLSIVRAIAVAHGGNVMLDSVLGRGSTCSVLIPVVSPGPEVQPWPPF